ARRADAAADRQRVAGLARLLRRGGARLCAAAGLQALGAELLTEPKLAGPRALLVRARRFEHAGEVIEARLREERRAAPAADLALADAGMAVAIGAERCLAVV